MFKKPFGLLGIFLVLVGVGYFIGAGVAYSKVQGGYGSLGAFSKAQNVELNYNDQGQLTDGGKVEGAQEIMTRLKDEWKFPVVASDLDPKNPLVNTATEYMYQMAAISTHTLDSTQHVVLQAKDLTGDDGTVAATFDCNGEQVAVPTPFPDDGVTCDFKVDGRYWTGFDRSIPVQAKARDLAWSGTAHALVAELGVGAATHSTLQLALGVAALLAGLGVVCTVMGGVFIWDTRRKGKLIVPDTIPESFVKDTSSKPAQTV
ncbi:MAG: hypothetical protein ABI862_00880 [Ilumatobacteraceae bacterium]